MEQRHDAADHVLCVVSDDYLKAPYSTLERNAALWQAVAKRPAFVLLVVVKPCRFRRCELFGMPEEAASVRFRDFMKTRAAPEAVAFPGKVFAVSNIPIRVPLHFMGRGDAVAAIEATLIRFAITALHGLRGWARPRSRPPMRRSIATKLARSVMNPSIVRSPSTCRVPNGSR